MKSSLGKLREAYDKLIIFQHEMSTHRERITKVTEALIDLGERVARLEEQQKTTALLVEKEVSRQILDILKSQSGKASRARKQLKPAP